MRLRLRATDLDQSSADCRCGLAARGRRTGAGVASSCRHERGRCRPGFRYSAPLRGSPGLPVGSADKSNSAGRSMSMSAKTGWCCTAMRSKTAGTFVYRVRAMNAGVFGGPACVCRRTMTVLLSDSGWSANSKYPVKPRDRGEIATKNHKRHKGPEGSFCDPCGFCGFSFPRPRCGSGCWSRPPLAERIPLSTAVWSANGELLRVTCGCRRSISGCGRRSRRCLRRW